MCWSYRCSTCRCQAMSAVAVLIENSSGPFISTRWAPTWKVSGRWYDSFTTWPFFHVCVLRPIPTKGYAVFFQKRCCFFVIQLIHFVTKEVVVPGHVSSCVIDGSVWIVHIIGQFPDMLVHVKCLEMVSDKSAMSFVISRPTVGLAGHGYVRIIDGTSSVGMKRR